MKQNNNFELDVRVTPIKNGGNVKAYASVNIGSAFAVKNLRIIEGNKGLFVSMPSVKTIRASMMTFSFPLVRKAEQLLIMRLSPLMSKSSRCQTVMSSKTSLLYLCKLSQTHYKI